MILSKAKHMIASKIRRLGTQYSSGSSKTFHGALSKSNVSQDMARADYVIMAAYNASIDDGKIISKGNKYYIPLQRDEPNFVENIMYKKYFLKVANASGDLYHFDTVLQASKHIWDIAPASEDWVKKKTGVFVNFEKLSLRVDNEAIGQIESGDFILLMPWSVNASFTPTAECRFTDRQGRSWKIEDVDDKTYFNQAYQLRVSQDDR